MEPLLRIGKDLILKFVAKIMLLNSESGAVFTCVISWNCFHNWLVVRFVRLEFNHVFGFPEFCLVLGVLYFVSEVQKIVIYYLEKWWLFCLTRIVESQFSWLQEFRVRSSYAKMISFLILLRDLAGQQDCSVFTLPSNVLGMELEGQRSFYSAFETLVYVSQRKEDQLMSNQVFYNNLAFNQLRYQNEFK